MNYYNEFDPKAAAWLRELIKAGHLPPGDVDTRSIVEIKPDEIAKYTQCHFFAGIGGWSLALRLAGWPDDKPAWTGSCPCQPFSVAGKREGEDDPRHLWPTWWPLIRECLPSIVFGEQVASKAALGWLDGVFTDLESAEYTCAAADLCAAGVGAPHIRQRLYWVADSRHQQGWRRPQSGQPQRATTSNGCRVGQSDTEGLQGTHGNGRSPGGVQCESPNTSGRTSIRVEHTNGSAKERFRPVGIPLEPEQEARRSGDANPWANSELIRCADGKARRIEPGTFPLAHGVPGRVGLLRGYGNAIVPELAAKFIISCEEAIHEHGRSGFLMNDPAF